MEYLPKSKLVGTVIAVLYLLFVALLLLVMGYWAIVNNWDIGGHNDPGVLIMFLLVIVTLPFSWVLIWMVDILKLELTKETVNFITIFIIPSVSALINAVTIYFIVVFLSQVIRKLFGHSVGNDKTE